MKISSIIKNPLLEGAILSNYEKLLNFSRLPLHSELTYRTVGISQNDYIHEIYTLNKKELPHMVMLHGWGGLSPNFQHLFSPLFKHYQMHSLDLLGFGLSSHKTWNQKFQFEEAKNYYVQSLEKWRVAVGIEKIQMMGLSFGAHIASFYAQKYPENMERLILLSPPSVSSAQNMKPEEQPLFLENKNNLINQLTYFSHFRPSTSAKIPILGRMFVKKTAQLYLCLKDEEELNCWVEHYLNVSMPNCSDGSLYKIFDWPLAAKRPIQTIIREGKFSFPVNFYYGGEKDWTEKLGSYRLTNEFQNISISIIESAGHNIPTHSPKDLSDAIKMNLQ